jgi:hypothetical protein
MKTFLAIDLSTTCTGWAVFNLETHELITYGFIKGKTVKDNSKWRATLLRLTAMAETIKKVIEEHKPTKICIEEIAGSKNRIGQKTLDMQHGILWHHISEYLDIVDYYDVSGAAGWRTHLKLKLSDADKLANKEAKKLNPKLGKGIPKLPIYDAKDLAARYVNSTYKLQLDPQMIQSDADVADSIAIGSAYLKFKFPKS